jgi:predicted  nucleic acid-binding Zn-ribbon protein
VDEIQCRRLFDLLADQGNSCEIPPDSASALDRDQVRQRKSLLEEMIARNGRWFDTEMDKLDRWAEDRRASLKQELEDLDEALKEAKKAARLAPTLPEKLERQREARSLEVKREEAWRAYDQASRDIDRQKDKLLDDLSQRLQHAIDEEPLFTLRWSLT